MTTIVLGREGNQPFKIKEDCTDVSRRHAEIIMDDNGQIFLSDLGSTNGTYIRDSTTGNLIRISRHVLIDDMTFIVLGADNACGCSFYARQAWKPGNFKKEYQYIQNKYIEFKEDSKMIEERISLIKKIIFAVNIMIVIYSLPMVGGETGAWLLRGGAIVSTAFTAFYDGAKKRILIREKFEKFLHCPNPLCYHKLSISEIKNLRCVHCRNIIK